MGGAGPCGGDADLGAELMEKMHIAVAGAGDPVGAVTPEEEGRQRMDRLEREVRELKQSRSLVEGLAENDAEDAAVEIGAGGGSGFTVLGTDGLFKLPVRRAYYKSDGSLVAVTEAFDSGTMFLAWTYDYVRAHS